MKAFVISLLLIPLATPALAAPDMAPFINNQIKQLTKKVDDDLAAGALTKSDADELLQAIDHVQSTETSEPSLTPRLRADLREKLSKIQVDLERKETQAKALSAASASPTP
jgi:hypothetical protein